MTDLQREYKALEDRFDDLERRTSGDLDPRSDERAFLRAVRVTYARVVGEGEGLAMWLGPEFLARACALQGLSVVEIVEVAMRIACQRPHEIDGREVHPLAESVGGSRQRTRARDGAKA